MEDVGIGLNEATESPLIADEAIPKERVTELVKREKEAAYRKAQREFQAQLDAQKTGQTQNMGGMQAAMPDMDHVYGEVTKRLQAEISKAQEESKKAEYEDYVKGQVSTFVKKMEGKSGLADDFNQMTAKFKPEEFPSVFYMANSFENTPELIYELSRDPEKLERIDSMSRKNPEFARDMMEKLSKSIEANTSAKNNNVSAPPPLSRPRPSLTAGADSGDMGLKDFKTAPWLRG